MLRVALGAAGTAVRTARAQSGCRTMSDHRELPLVYNSAVQEILRRVQDLDIRIEQLERQQQERDLPVPSS